MSHGFKQMKKVSRYVGGCLKEGLLAFTQQQWCVGRAEPFDGMGMDMGGAGWMMRRLSWRLSKGRSLAA
jgi:hypothetical protein